MKHLSMPQCFHAVIIWCFLFCLFMTPLLFCSSTVYASQGIDSTLGTDLPINAGGTRAMTIQSGTGRVAVGGSHAPNGTLDVENGANTATICLNGSCTTQILPPTCNDHNVLQFDGTTFVCTSLTKLIPEASPGAVCGFASQDHVYGHINVTLCQGNDPQYSCPSGYTSHIIFQADGNFLYTCLAN